MGEPTEIHTIEVTLDRILAARNLTLTELSQRVGISIVNLSVLKNGRARAIRFSTLGRLCEVLRCQPGDLLIHRPARSDGHDSGANRT
jgi:putative transcriptional regulator